MSACTNFAPKRAASILSNAPSVTGRGLWCVPVGTHIQWGLIHTTEVGIGISPAYSCFLALAVQNTLPLFVAYRPHEAGVLGAFGKSQFEASQQISAC